MSAVSLIVVAAATEAVAGQRWDVEAHGGALLSTNPSAGTKALPPPEVPIALIPPANLIGEPVASWFFGDGAALIAQVTPSRLNAGIIALDPVLQSRFVERRSGSSLGVRVGRSLSPRLGAEVALDYASGQLALLTASTDRLTASEASFLTTWNALLSGPAGGNQQVTSDATFVEKRGAQIITSGALLMNLSSNDAVTPYLAVGAGYISAAGRPPSATVTGNYRFNLMPVAAPAGQLQIIQTDTVAIQSIAKNTLTWVVGGGLKYAVSPRWGVRADVRDHIIRDVVRTVVSATPSSASATGSGAITLFFGSGSQLVFAFSPLFRSTLSATVSDFPTFIGRGIVNQVNARRPVCTGDSRLTRHSASGACRARLRRTRSP